MWFVNAKRVHKRYTRYCIYLILTLPGNPNKKMCVCYIGVGNIWYNIYKQKTSFWRILYIAIFFTFKPNTVIHSCMAIKLAPIYMKSQIFEQNSDCAHFVTFTI